MILDSDNDDIDINDVMIGRRCSPRPIDALRFERMGTHEWGIVETKVQIYISVKYRYSYRTNVHRITVCYLL
jgi:hypothetical protein